ncbi:endolytic transglycosylase MltG [Leptotrichia sp. oral taxon 847]|uniref:endolytic transglycosylase MltG n=1 Tax=Leptotrichia sp. oral taxon 847 TaxID=1785996 RepID=UPI0007683FF9|nr:endolytic transglycosylase MltG [Leptotrichia sp. oral taxon 847]AMD94408.1 aminodeoxychorismate lyase [Leptotrichia sp. oral taxon 847]
MKNTIKIFNIFMFILLFIFLIFFYNFFVSKKEYKNVSIDVKRGTNFSQIYKSLKLNYGILDRVYLKLSGKNNLKIGVYRFNGKLSKYEVIRKIKRSEISGIRLTIPEGFTSKQVFERMDALGLGTEEEIKKSLAQIKFPYPHKDNNFEGYFYPETYIFAEDVTTREVLETVLKEFLRRFPPEKYPDKQKFYDNLKLASIVEAEVPDEKDKPKVAGLFLKRLKIGMRLESDATLKYVLRRQAKSGELKASMSPYNSYRFAGLPPTPIGNPPYETFKAVQNAEITDNLFFFTYNGKTYYSKTHEEHLQKRKESGQMK